MSLDKMNQISNLNGLPREGLQKPSRAADLDIGSDSSFKDTLSSLVKTKDANTQVLGAESLSPLKFSSHAVDRMRTRGISFSPETMGKIDSAINTAKAKGAKSTLVLADNAAMIVSTKNNTVVTVMDKMNMKENVFTNIDSTVMV